MFMRQPKSVDAMNQETSAVDMLVSDNSQPQTVRVKIKAAQNKQEAQYNARKRKGKRLVTVCPGDQVMKKNARKDTRQGGRLQPCFTGPYTVKAITSSGQSTLVNSAGVELATHYNVALLKPYVAQTVAELPSTQSRPNEDSALGQDAGLVQEQEATESRGATSDDRLR